MEGDILILGPFQGNSACVYIPMGKGVCGMSLKEKRTLIIPDIEQFPGHIACDLASRSEIVIPMVKDGKAIGVLDIDSPILDRFDKIDRKYLEEIVNTLTSKI